MNYSTKFSKGDIVYFIESSEIKHGIIKGIGIEDDIYQGFQNSIKYRIDTATCFVDEQSVFSSIQDLTNSLQEKFKEQ